MRALRAHRRLPSWIAVLALLLASLAPSLGKAMGSGEAASWIEVCTAQGSKWIPADEDSTESAPASAHGADHCVYCSPHVPMWGLPPAGVLTDLALSVSHEVPRAFLAAPCSLHAWVSAQPRAPPLFS